MKRLFLFRAGVSGQAGLERRNITIFNIRLQMNIEDNPADKVTKMPGPKRRRFIIRQRQKAREKRGRATRLSEDERRKLHDFKIRGQWEIIHSRGNIKRSLADVNTEHGRNFEDVVRGLARRFPKERIQVLDEGAGNSEFGTQLTERLKDEVDVSVEKTDINFPHLKQMVSPEELVERFGRDRFHLVVSTFGGTQYTTISRRRALANIIAVLKPGGIASILTGAGTLGTFTQTGALEWKKYESLLKRFKNVRVLEKGGCWLSVLTIEKLRA